MARPALLLSSNRPDLRILRILEVVQSIFLPLIVAVAGTTLFAWLVPFSRNLLPTGWDVMKANTAVLALLSVLGIFLSHSRRSARSVLMSRLLGASVAVLSAATIVEYLFHISLGLDTLLDADSHALLPGRMSLQTATAFLVLGIVLLNLRARKRTLAYVIDGLVLCLTLMMLVFTAGYAFGAMGLFGLTMQHRLSPQTLFCLILLNFLVFNRRTEYGVFSILIDDGIGGKTARLAAPFALLLPFVLPVIRGLVTRSKWIPEQYGIALASALLALVGFGFTLLIAKRCKYLDGINHELSLCDQLTQLYNRRGFYLLAEQRLGLACRAGDSFFLIFIDLDDLKQTNDNLGHEAGSNLLQEMASLLEKNFRKTDILGRLGGDEFIVAGTGHPPEILGAIQRLEEAANTRNSISSEQYSLNYSLGYVIAESNGETLDDLIQKADAIMYAAKRKRKHDLNRTLDVPAASMQPPQRDEDLTSA